MVNRLLFFCGLGLQFPHFSLEDTIGVFVTPVIRPKSICNSKPV